MAAALPPPEHDEPPLTKLLATGAMMLLGSGCAAQCFVEFGSGAALPRPGGRVWSGHLRILRIGPVSVSFLLRAGHSLCEKQGVLGPVQLHRSLPSAELTREP